MPVQLRLVHAEPGSRVVEARAIRAGELLAMALGEASTAEEAEQRARQRLQQQLDAMPGTAAPPQPPRTVPVEPVPVEPVPVQPIGIEPAATEPVATEPAAREPVPAAPVLAPQAPPNPAATAATAASAKPEEPAADPDDWSAELARIDLALKRIGWQRSEEGQYLERAFGHPSRSRLTAYHDLLAYLRLVEQLEPGCDPHTAPVPLRRSELLSQSDALLSQLGWDVQQAKQFLEQNLGRASRQQLNESQLLQFNMLLEEALMAAGATAEAATGD